MKMNFKDFLNEELEEEMKQKYYIYTLSDPIDGEIKYIGKTNNLKNRLWRHISPCHLKSSWIPKNKWVLWLKNQGLRPIIEVLDEGDENNIDDLERYWIGQFKQWGYKLKNVSDGGPNPSYWKGKNIPLEMRLKILMNNPNRKPVNEYEIGTDKLIGEYISVSEAGRKTGHKRDTILYSCIGKSVPHKFGVYWRFKDNYFPYVEPDLKHTDEDLLKMKMNHPFRKTICQYEIGTDKLIAEYDSSHDVERILGFNHNNISKCCKGVENYNTVGVFYWRFKDNYFPHRDNKNIKDYVNIIIHQYDENWNFIKEYISSHQAKKDEFYLPGIKRSIINGNLYKNYHWKIIEK